MIKLNKKIILRVAMSVVALIVITFGGLVFLNYKYKIDPHDRYLAGPSSGSALNAATTYDRIAKNAALTVTGKVVGGKLDNNFLDHPDYDQDLVKKNGLDDATFSQFDFRIDEVFVNNTKIDYKPGDIVPLIRVTSPDGVNPFQPNPRALLGAEDTYFIYLTRVHESLTPSYVLGSTDDIGVVTDSELKFLNNDKVFTLSEFRKLLK